MADLTFNAIANGTTVKVGDRVMLKSGGPVLVVAKVEEDHIECLWFDDDADLQSSTFPPETLKEVG